MVVVVKKPQKIILDSKVGDTLKVSPIFKQIKSKGHAKIL